MAIELEAPGDVSYGAGAGEGGGGPTAGVDISISTSTTTIGSVLDHEPAETKIYNIVDLNLFSGSSDVFRTAVGGFWNIGSGSIGHFLSFQNYDRQNPLLNYFENVLPNSSLEEAVSDTTITHSKKLPIRVQGKTNVVNDKHWNVLFVGGEFAGNTVQPIYNENLYNYHVFESSIPYSNKEASVVEGNSFSSKLQISYDYRKYLPKYEDYVKNLSSELLMPNYYVITDLQSYGVVDSGDGIIVTDDSGNEISYDRDVINYVTLEGKYPDIDGLFTSISEDVLYANSGRTFLTNEYLTSSLVNNPLSSSTESAIKHKFQNIILDDDALYKLYNQDNITQYSTMFPYYTKIKVPLTKTMIEVTSKSQTYMEPDTTFVDYIVENKYTNKFLKSLKEVFNNELTDLQPTETDYAMAMQYVSSSRETFVNTDVLSVREANIRTIDFMKMIAHDYDNYNSQTDNCYFVGEKNIYRDSMFDRFGIYRYMNTISSVKTMANVSDYLNSNSSYNLDGLIDFLYQDDNPCIKETLAYRIQKVGGAPTGDSRTQNTLQNYWLLNSSELEEFNFFDTQVKYGTDYTYHIYEYVLVLGLKYKFSDLRLTQAISENNTLEVASTSTSTTTTFYGLEFYDPVTGEKVEQLYDRDPGGDFTTLIQEKSEYPYLADFNLEYEPVALIFEMPIMSKTQKILDNPPNIIGISPYQHTDSSQKIGFEMRYGAHEEKEFPTVITSADEKLKQDYLNGRDFYEGDAISEYAESVTGTIPNSTDTVEIDIQFLKSVSSPRFIEVYRLDQKPTAYTDFDNNRIKTVDLKIQNSENTYTTEFFDDKIKTNSKYYYLFRVLNEQLVPGHISEIYETELINDGGYLYAIFNTLDKSDLEQNIFTDPARTFKKILHFEPALSQLALNLDNVDFEQEAHSQINNLQVGVADDLIWDKEFKIRLTSKKTGRKIDFNITYKLN